MYEKINYTLVGIFVIVTTSLLILFALWLGKDSVAQNNYNKYYCYFKESVDGLNVDSVVKLNGVNVGRLNKLKIAPKEPSKIEATLLIDKNIKITKDMYAILKSQGLTGLRYINIIGGASKEIIIPNKKTSIIKTKLSLVSKLSDSAPVLLEKMSDFSKKLDKTLSDKNIKNIDAILENSKEITANAIKLEKKFNNIVSDMNNSKIKSILQIAKDLNNSINNTLLEYKKLAKNGNLTLKIVNKNLPKLIHNINKSSKELQKASILIRKTINRGDYNLRKILKPAIVDFRELSIGFKETEDELNAILKDPANKIFNGASAPKGPGE